MATVKCPLLSLTAQGDLAKIITYRRVGRTNVVSEYSSPTDRKSGAQSVHRTGMHDAREAWRDLSLAEKETWREKAIGIPGTSGYNLFIKYYLESYLESVKPFFNKHLFNEVYFN